MKLKQALNKKGLKWFLIKLGIFIAVGISVQLFISLFFRYTTFFETYLSIPADFTIEAPNIRNILLNAFMFGIVATMIFFREKLLNIKNFNFSKQQIIFIVTTVLFLFGQYLFKYLINRNTDYFLRHALFWGIIKIIINIFFIASLFIAVFGIPFTKYILKNYRKEIIFFTSFSLAFFFLMLIVQNLWTYFSGTISFILYHIFSLFFDNVTYKPFVTSLTMSEGGGPLLGINGFKAIVGKPCSGIDSFLLFTSLYSLIFVLDYKKLKKKLAVGMFFVGVSGMFITNLIRILLLFIVGAFIDKKFAIGMFHSNIGWILFIAYFFVFWMIVSKYIYKKGDGK